jgi:hypothetical protein
MTLASPVRCTLLPGEILYIPAMWYHRVSQSCLTIAVNYWVEQTFDFKFAFYQTARCLFHKDDYSVLADDDEGEHW